MEEKIKSLLAVALRGMTILPGMAVHFDVSRERSIAAVQEALTGKEEIFLVTQRDIGAEDPTQDDVYEVGVIASVRHIMKLPKNILRVLVYGEVRGKLLHFEEKDPFLRASVEVMEEEEITIPDGVNGQAMERGLK